MNPTGIELAARYVEKRRDDYVQEHGSYDPSTGMTEFPGTGEEYVGELEEIIEGIRALAATPASAAEPALVYPADLTDDLRDVLSLMMWNTAPIAHVLQAGGADIPTKGELEHAHVLHWLTLLALEHGPAWRHEGSKRLKEIRANLTIDT